MRHTAKLLSILALSISSSVFAGSLTLSSQDIAHGEFMSKAQEFGGFGCSGGNLSPHLKWDDAPKGTKSFAITAYDPDAPTGSGWWHWQVVNIPITVMEISTGSGEEKQYYAPTQGLSTASTPIAGTQIKNDYGSRSYGGACPPKGHGAHRYRFTVYALSVEKLALPKDASGALTGYMINTHTIESSTIESLYKRD